MGCLEQGASWLSTWLRNWIWTGVAVEVTEIGDHYDPTERKVRLVSRTLRVVR